MPDSVEKLAEMIMRPLLVHGVMSHGEPDNERLIDEPAKRFLATAICAAIQEVAIPLADFDGVQQKLIEELYQKVEALETENAALSRQQSVISGKVEGLEKRLGKVQGAALYITEATP